MRRFYALHGHWHAKRQGKIMNEIRSASEPRMKKALIYARFSTDLQNERSIEDQITLCRDSPHATALMSSTSMRTERVRVALLWGAMAYFA